MRFSAAVFLLLFASAASAQTRPTGYVSTFVDLFPSRGDTAEIRARVFAEQSITPLPAVQVTLSGFAEGLLGWRSGGDGSGRRRVTDAIVRGQEATVLLRAKRVDVYAGYGVIAWGRLDELQPTDVINPLDVSRFFFEGRSEARLPAALVRGRIFATDGVFLEAVYVPAFRRGRFDRLDEPTSPFNVVPELPPLAFDDREPEVSIRNAQGGARFNATTGRVDWSVSVYRGFEPFGTYSIEPGALLVDNRLHFYSALRGWPRTGARSQPEAFPVAYAFQRAPEWAVRGQDRPGRFTYESDGPVVLVREYPRFTMVGGDFETVAGKWGVRGEAAAFVRDSFQGEAPVPSIVRGRSFDAGAGVDRKAGDYRVSGTVLVHREAYDAPLVASAAPETTRTDVSFIASADRAFAREKYNVRLFGVYGATEGSGFVRAIATAKLRDDVAVEGSAGWFAGGGRDLVGRFADSDFLYARLKVYF